MKFLKVDIHDKVARVILNRPEIHNAFNEEMIDELIQLFSKDLLTKNIHLVVMEGEGKSFSAGADLNWMKKMKNYSMEENIRDSQKLGRMFDVMDSFPWPIIAKVHGAALGGALGLIAVSDYVIVSKETMFAFSEVKLGLIPAVIGPYCLKKIGQSFARAYFTSGRRFNYHQAFHMGLIHEYVDKEMLEEATQKTIDEYKSAGPQAIKLAKELIKGICKRNEGEAKDYTYETIAKKRISDEGQEGMSALLEKRKPQWL